MSKEPEYEMMTDEAWEAAAKSAETWNVMIDGDCSGQYYSVSRDLG